MIDTHPCATPMPAQPGATVTSTATLPPPPAPLPHDVAPEFTDSVSNLDFLPVDDAFALEMRSETIEQLVGGDALRHGVSERIEAGRSQTNADLVAGRDRVRVQGTLHEHNGHGLAEQAAHLHITVDGTLDVHAATEDTVLLAGHMRDLWDGGTAIVAAMTDDLAAGGGIRVTTPLDLWMHGLMGMEERIGTCTADAVLLELGATHYEREYGPGVHAAGLAVYAGSLYQSSRSTFRPLMRVSSGVRNLIAGGDGGGAGDGARRAPAASPPPMPAQTGAASEAVTATLAAGRGAVETPATALDAADELTGARRVPLEELVNSVDARATGETGGAGIVMRAENLPELTRSTNTAEQIGALQETLRMDATESASGFRTSEFQGTVSTRPATGGGGPLEIEPPPAIYGENASMVHPHPDFPWGQGPEMKPELLGDADRPPQSAAQESDFPAVYHRLREIRGDYAKLSRADIVYDSDRALDRVSQSIVDLFERFGGNPDELTARPFGTTREDQAYLALRKMARQADGEYEPARAGTIRKALDAIGGQAVAELEELSRKYGIAEVPSTQVIQQPPVAAGPTVPVESIPPPTRTPMQLDRGSAYWRLRDLSHHFLDTGPEVARADFYRSADRISNQVMRRFRKFGGDSQYLLQPLSDATEAEQAYRAIEDMYRRATESGDVARTYRIRRALDVINGIASAEVDRLTTRYGALDALATRDLRAMQLPPPRFGPTTSAALPVTVRPPATVLSTTAPPPGRLDVPVPVHAIDPEVTSAFSEPAGWLVDATGIPGPPPASGLPGPSLAEAASAHAGDLRRWGFDPPAASGTTAAHPAATEATVTPSLAGTSSFWQPPADPVPTRGTVAFDSGLHHAGETVQPPPATTTASSTASALDAPPVVPWWLDRAFRVERAVMAGELPPGFDALRLIVEARTYADFGLAEELAAGRLPLQTIDGLLDGYRGATDEGGGNALVIEDLRSLKESILRDLRTTYPGRIDSRWLDRVREILLEHGAIAAPRRASATGPAEHDVTVIGRFLGTGGGVSHPVPPPPPSGPASAGAPRPSADPWRIRPPEMRGEPHPDAFDPWSSPSGPGSRVVHSETPSTLVVSADAPPGWQRAETSRLAQVASAAVSRPFSRRRRTALRFGADDALLEAGGALQTGGAGELGWPATRWRAVLDDPNRLNAIALSGAAAMADID